MARCIYILNYLSIQDKGAGQGKNDVSLSGLANINNVGLVRCWKRVLKGILIKHCHFCRGPWCQHTHHHHIPRPSSPATSAQAVDQSEPRVWPEWLARPPIGCRGGDCSSATNESWQSRCKAKNQFPANCG